MAAIVATTAKAQRFPKVAARLAAGHLDRPTGRRDETVDLDALAIDGTTAARLGAVSSPTRLRTGRRAAELPTGP